MMRFGPMRLCTVALLVGAGLLALGGLARVRAQTPMNCAAYPAGSPAAIECWRRDLENGPNSYWWHQMDLRARQESRGRGP